jgi:hypothetical protein
MNGALSVFGPKPRCRRLSRHPTADISRCQACFFRCAIFERYDALPWAVATNETARVHQRNCRFQQRRSWRRVRNGANVRSVSA